MPNLTKLGVEMSKAPPRYTDQEYDNDLLTSTKKQSKTSPKMTPDDLTGTICQKIAVNNYGSVLQEEKDKLKAELYEHLLVKKDYHNLRYHVARLDTDIVCDLISWLRGRGFIMAPDTTLSGRYEFIDIKFNYRGK